MRVAGLISVAVNGTRIDASGSFEYNLGLPMREAVVGHDGVHGYRELPQVPFIAGDVRVTRDLDVRGLLTARDATVTLTLPTGAVVVLRDAWFAGEGTANTEDGNIAARFEGKSADLSRAA